MKQDNAFFILLDLDGVMIITPSWKQTDNLDDGFPDFNPIAVASLNKILEHTKGKIILTTSHKSRFDIDKWLEIFKRRGVIIDSIDKLEPNIIRLRRREEILRWLNDNPEADYVIIDDDKSLNEMSNFVLTLSYRGLTYEETNNVINLYNSNNKK